MNNTIEWDERSGVFLRREALASGLDDRYLARAVARGELHRVRTGAYVVGDRWRSSNAVQRHRITARAVLATAHPGATLSHFSAAAEWDVPLWRSPLDEVHLTRPGRAGRREDGIARHRGRVPDDQVVERNGVRVTLAARTAHEIICTADAELALVVVNGLVHAGHVTAEDLEAHAQQFRHWPGSLRTRVLLPLIDPRLQSVAETRFVWLSFQHGLPRPEPQVSVHDESGSLVAIVDFLWREHGLFLEFDGRIKYTLHRRDGESLEEYVMREKKREETVSLLTGWRCVRITWEDLGRPERLARRIRRLLDLGSPHAA